MTQFELSLIDHKCRNCKHCSDYNIVFGCYQCMIDYHATNKTDTCKNWAYDGTVIDDKK